MTRQVLKKKLNLPFIFFHHSNHNNNQISARDHRLAVMVGAICASYILCNIPVFVIKVLDLDHSHPYLFATLMSLFWTQYSMNFVIYAASNKQYRCVSLVLQKFVVNLTLIYFQGGLPHLPKRDIVFSGVLILLHLSR